MDRDTPAYLLRGQNIERVFSDPKDAACYFLNRNLHLPGDLDGWKVVE